MQRAVTIALAVAVVVLAVLLAKKSTSGPEASTLVVDAGAPLDAAVPAAIDAAPPALEEEPTVATDLVDAGPMQLADGTPVAPLGPKAPKRVRFGVVLVTYDGAEGAPPKARSKKDALPVADRLAGDAKADFAGAVKEGDEGSAADVGIVDRNILEPTAEAVLFALPVGGTSGVIDTPRGFWIVKRLE